MTITELARVMSRNDSYQRQTTAQPKLPNGSLPPPGHVNPYCPPGMDITGIQESDLKEIPVSSDIVQKLKNLAFDNMKNYYGMSGPNSDKGPDMIEAYCLQAPVKDRINAGFTLTRIHRAEANRLVDFVRFRIPGWQVGDAFDTSILDEYQQGIDVQA